MKPAYRIDKNRHFYTSAYFNGYFRNIYIILDDQNIDFNVKCRDIVSDIKSRLKKIHEELLRYYENCKDVEEEIAAFYRNESDILSRYETAKSISKEYTDQILEHGRAKEN